jgi:glutamate-1-semialdehyde 2,1-aminomutase
MSLIPMGCNVSSKGRWRFAEGSPHAPKWIVSGQGAFVTSETGRNYLDLTAGLGAITLGHREDEGSMQCPNAYPMPHPNEERLAKYIQERIPWAEQMRFMKNGGDATSAAVRIARVYTGRDLIVDFGNYHGCQDAWITPDHEGVPQAIRDLTLRLAPEAANLARIDDRTACVILEAAPLKPLPEGFLALLQKQCAVAGAVLIFDDVISGFRAHPQGAAGITGIVPDLTCAGKAMGNGWPISMVYGRADIMGCWARTHLSATHWADPTAMACAIQVQHTMQLEGFWDKQREWTFGGQKHNGYWSVLSMTPVRQTFVQSLLLERGIITNFSQFFYLDLVPHKGWAEQAFADALGIAEQYGDDEAMGNELKARGISVNKTVFKRH